MTVQSDAIWHEKDVDDEVEVGGRILKLVTKPELWRISDGFYVSFIASDGDNSDVFVLPTETTMWRFPEEGYVHGESLLVIHEFTKPADSPEMHALTVALGGDLIFDCGYLQAVKKNTELMINKLQGYLWDLEPTANPLVYNAKARFDGSIDKVDQAPKVEVSYTLGGFFITYK